MNKILKYLLLTVGAVVVVLIAVAVYLAATFDPNDYKPQIVQLVKDKLDRTLRIGGDIKLTFYPVLGADLGQLSLSERASDKNTQHPEIVSALRKAIAQSASKSFAPDPRTRIHTAG